VRKTKSNEGKPGKNKYGSDDEEKDDSIEETKENTKG
jgi:hypothetical protein